MVCFALAVRRGGFDFGAANGVLLLACLRFGSWQVEDFGDFKAFRRLQASIQQDEPHLELSLDDKRRRVIGHAYADGANKRPRTLIRGRSQEWHGWQGAKQIRKK